MAVSTVPIVIYAGFLFSGMFKMQFYNNEYERAGAFQSEESVKLNFSGPVSLGSEIANQSEQQDGTGHNGANKLSLICGPGNCSETEICVSWMKHIINPKGIVESPLMLHECLPHDGMHWNKMTPSSGKLCELGKTHSILKQSQQCLRDNPPCGLLWKYICVDKKDSPHSCSLKQCPNNGGCIEVIHCGLEPPCFKEATCIPKFFTRHTTRH